MIKMKKIISTILSITMAVTAVATLSSCAGEKNSATTADGKVILTVGNWPDSETNPKGYETYMNRKEAFEEKYPDIQVEPDYWTYDTQTFVAKAEGGTLPIIYNTFATEAKKIMDLGYAADITEVMEQYGFLDLMTDEIKDLVSRDGKVYMIPASIYTMGLVMNLNLFREAGLVDENGDVEIPETFDDLRATAKTIHDKTGKAGFVFPTTANGGGWNFMSLAWSYGGSFVSQDDDGWKSVFDSEEVSNALQLLRDMQWEDGSMPATTLVNNDDAMKLVGTDQAAMAFAHPGQVDLLVSQYDMDCANIGYAKMPAGPEKRITLMGGGYLCIAPNATPEQIDAAIKWLDFSGNTPKTELTDDVKENIRATYETKIAEKTGVVGIKDLSFWKDEEATQHYKNEVISELRNIDEKQIASYNDKSDIEYQAEEPMKTQDLYSVLDSCIQEVLTNKDASCREVLKKAASDFQNNYLNGAN